MGRIHEALQKAGVRNASSITTSRADDGVTFRAAWPALSGASSSSDDTTVPTSPGLSHDLESRVQTAQPISAEWAERLITSATVSPAVVEQFRRLAATLHVAHSATNSLKVLLVTSAEPGDGKTFTAANLALTLSESYRRRVLLVDMDFRRPSLSNITDARPTRGLAEGLKSRSEQKLPVLRMTERLTLLPAGRPELDPMSSLTSPRMQRVLSDAAEAFDWVILDAPPLAVVTDARLVAELADGVLLVIRAGQTPYASVQKSIDSIGRERVFGVVLNGIDGAVTSRYHQADPANAEGVQ
jgi:receptor protein-tyrosine kinase